MNEVSQPAEYSQEIINLIAILENNPPDTHAGLAAICHAGYTYIYIGQGQGLVGYQVSQLFKRELLLNSPNFQEIYHQDRVSVFSINQKSCQNLINGN
jgi:hypothetical protein